MYSVCYGVTMQANDPLHQLASAIDDLQVQVTALKGILVAALVAMDPTTRDAVLLKLRRFDSPTDKVSYIEPRLKAFQAEIDDFLNNFR